MKVDIAALLSAPEPYAIRDMPPAEPGAFLRLWSESDVGAQPAEPNEATAPSELELPLLFTDTGRSLSPPPTLWRFGVPSTEPGADGMLDVSDGGQKLVPDTDRRAAPQRDPTLPVDAHDSIAPDVQTGAGLALTLPDAHWKQGFAVPESEISLPPINPPAQSIWDTTIPVALIPAVPGAKGTEPSNLSQASSTPAPTGGATAATTALQAPPPDPNVLPVYTVRYYPRNATATDPSVAAGQPAAGSGTGAPSVVASPGPANDATWAVALARAAETHARLPADHDQTAPRPEVAASPATKLLAPLLNGADVVASGEPGHAEGAPGLAYTDISAPRTDLASTRSATAELRAPPSPVNQIGDAVRATAGSRVELRLAPEELGRVTLSFQPDGDGVRVHLVADRPDTLDLFRRHTADLEAELRAAGYDSASFSFASGGRDPEGSSEDGGGRQTADSPPDPDPMRPADSGSAGAGALDLRL